MEISRVSRARRVRKQATINDADPSKAIIADTTKLASFCFILSFIKGWEKNTFSRIEKTYIFVYLSGGQFRLTEDTYEV